MLQKKLTEVWDAAIRLEPGDTIPAGTPLIEHDTQNDVYIFLPEGEEYTLPAFGYGVEHRLFDRVSPWENHREIKAEGMGLTRRTWLHSDSKGEWWTTDDSNNFVFALTDELSGITCDE